MWKVALLAGALALGSGSAGSSAAEVLAELQLDRVSAAGVRPEKLEARIAILDRKVTRLLERRQSLVDDGKGGNERLETRITNLQDRIAAIRDRLDASTGEGGDSARAFVLENGEFREIDVRQGQDSVSVTSSVDHGSSGSNGGMVVLTRP